MKPLEKKIRKKNDKILCKSINSENLKVTLEDNYNQISENNTATGKKSEKRKINKKPIIEEKEFPKETKCLIFSRIKTFLKEHKLLAILSLVVILILVAILIFFVNKKNTKKDNSDIPSKSSGAYIPSEPEQDPNSESNQNLIQNPIQNPIQNLILNLIQNLNLEKNLYQFLMILKQILIIFQR